MVRDGGVLLPKNLGEWPQNRWEVFLRIASEADKKKVEGFKPATWGTYSRHELFTNEAGTVLVIFAKDASVDVSSALVMKPPGSHTPTTAKRTYRQK